MVLGITNDDGGGNGRLLPIFQHERYEAMLEIPILFYSSISGHVKRR